MAKIKDYSIINILCLVFAILSMVFLCCEPFGGVFACISIVLGIIYFRKGKDKMYLSIVGFGIACMMFIWSLIYGIGLMTGFISHPTQNNQKETISQSQTQVQKETETEIKMEKQTEKQTEKVPEVATQKPTVQQTEKQTKGELSEQEYKDLCAELYYNDVFYGKNDLKDKYVKLNLFVSERSFFTTDALYSSSFQKLNDKYKLKRDILKCCVLRKDTNSYVGYQIKMYFSQNNNINPNDYKTGEKITVYGQVILWSDNTMSGYNSVTIIPKYIEKSE